MEEKYGFILFYRKNGDPSKPYYLRSGDTTIGLSTEADVRLKMDNPLLQEVHCIIVVNEEDGGTVTLVNKSVKAPVEVNGKPLIDSIVLGHEDKFEVVGKQFRYFNENFENCHQAGKIGKRKSVMPFTKTPKKSPTLKIKRLKRRRVSTRQSLCCTNEFHTSSTPNSKPDTGNIKEKSKTMSKIRASKHLDSPKNKKRLDLDSPKISSRNILLSASTFVDVMLSPKSPKRSKFKMKQENSFLDGSVKTKSTPRKAVTSTRETADQISGSNFNLTPDLQSQRKTPKTDQGIKRTPRNKRLEELKRPFSSVGKEKLFTSSPVDYMSTRNTPKIEEFDEFSDSDFNKTPKSKNLRKTPRTNELTKRTPINKRLEDLKKPYSHSSKKKAKLCMSSPIYSSEKECAKNIYEMLQDNEVIDLASSLNESNVSISANSSSKRTTAKLAEIAPFTVLQRNTGYQEFDENTFSIVELKERKDDSKGHNTSDSYSLSKSFDEHEIFPFESQNYSSDKVFTRTLRRSLKKELNTTELNNPVFSVEAPETLCNGTMEKSEQNINVIATELEDIPNSVSDESSIASFKTTTPILSRFSLNRSKSKKDSSNQFIMNLDKAPNPALRRSSLRKTNHQENLEEAITSPFSSPTTTLRRDSIRSEVKNNSSNTLSEALISNSRRSSARKLINEGHCTGEFDDSVFETSPSLRKSLLTKLPNKDKSNDASLGSSNIPSILRRSSVRKSENKESMSNEIVDSPKYVTSTSRKSAPMKVVEVSTPISKMSKGKSQNIEDLNYSMSNISKTATHIRRSSARLIQNEECPNEVNIDLSKTPKNSPIILNHNLSNTPLPLLRRSSMRKSESKHTNDSIIDLSETTSSSSDNMNFRTSKTPVPVLRSVRKVSIAAEEIVTPKTKVENSNSFDLNISTPLVLRKSARKGSIAAEEIVTPNRKLENSSSLDMNISTCKMPAHVLRRSVRKGSVTVEDTVTPNAKMENYNSVEMNISTCKTPLPVLRRSVRKGSVTAEDIVTPNVKVENSSSVDMNISTCKTPLPLLRRSVRKGSITAEESATPNTNVESSSSGDMNISTYKTPVPVLRSVRKGSIAAKEIETPDTKVINYDKSETPKSAMKPRALKSFYKPTVEDISPATPPVVSVLEDSDKLFKTPVNTPGLFESLRKSAIRSRKRGRESTGSVIRTSKKLKMETSYASDDSIFGQEVYSTDVDESSENLADGMDFRLKIAKRQKSPQNIDIKKSTPALKIRKSPKNDLSDVKGVKKLLSTPKIQQSPINDLTDVRGVKKLLTTPKVRKSPKNDLTDIKGVKKLLTTPKIQHSPINDLTDVRGVKKLLTTPKVRNSPKNDLTDIKGVKKLLSTPKVQSSPVNDLTDVRGVKKLLSTPKQRKSPKNDLSNVAGIKKLLSTFKKTKSPKNDLSDVRGVRNLLTTPKNMKSPKNDLREIPNLRRIMSPKNENSPKNDLSEVYGIKKLFTTPKPVKQPVNDLSDVEGVADIFNMSCDNLLNQGSDIENSEELFNKLLGHKPLRTYRGRSTSPRRSLVKYKTTRKTIGDSPETSPRLQKWVEEQALITSKKSFSEEAAEELEELDKTKKRGRQKNRTEGKMVNVRQVKHSSVESNIDIENLSEPPAPVTSRRRKRIMSNNDIDTVFKDPPNPPGPNNTKRQKRVLKTDEKVQIEKLQENGFDQARRKLSGDDVLKMKDEIQKSKPDRGNKKTSDTVACVEEADGISDDKEKAVRTRGRAKRILKSDKNLNGPIDFNSSVETTDNKKAVDNVMSNSDATNHSLTRTRGRAKKALKSDEYLNLSDSSVENNDAEKVERVNSVIDDDLSIKNNSATRTRGRSRRVLKSDENLNKLVEKSSDLSVEITDNKKADMLDNVTHDKSAEKNHSATRSRGRGRRVLKQNKNITDVEETSVKKTRGRQKIAPAIEIDVTPVKKTRSGRRKQEVIEIDLPTPVTSEETSASQTLTEKYEEIETVSDYEIKEASPIKKRRGRPKKVMEVKVEEESSGGKEEALPMRKTRGRGQKATEETNANDMPGVKKTKSATVIETVDSPRNIRSKKGVNSRYLKEEYEIKKATQARINNDVKETKKVRFQDSTDIKDDNGVDEVEEFSVGRRLRRTRK